MRSSGLFVSFEGIDGSGKTTCLGLVAERLRAANVPVLVVKLPGEEVDGETVGSDIGKGLRQLLWFEPSTKGMAPGVADLLLLADHVQVTERVIKPALEDGMVVLCDRYTDSQVAYSAHPSKRSPPWAMEFYERLATLEPDLTLLLLSDPETAWSRSKARAGQDGARQAGKAWEGLEAQAVIQSHYERGLRGLSRTCLIHVDNLGPREVAAEAYSRVLASMKARQE